VRGDPPDHGHHLGQQLLVPVSEVDQGRRVHLRDHHDVHRVGGIGVLEREDVLGLHHHLDLREPGMAWWQ
jgi:hypothetical protein